MSGQHALETQAAGTQQPDGAADRFSRACYTTKQIVALLQISARSFFALKRRGELPFLEELRPRLGRTVRYRADLINRYLAGDWYQAGAFRSHARKSAARRASTVSPQFGQTGS